MRRYLFLLATVLLLQACSTRQNVEKIEVSNPTADVRTNEMVELDYSVITERLSLDSGEKIVLFDENDNEVPYQLTFDNKIIFLANLNAYETKSYRIEVGTPKQSDTYAVGALYPERKDDVAWENDRIAFRAYGPALQESGEKAYGYDVWVKRVDYPVVAQRYADELNADTQAKIEQLKATDSVAAEELYNSVSYHNDHGNGLDYYKVGPTLGAGTSALIDTEGQIVYPYCYEQCEILENGPLRYTMSLRYRPFVFENDTVVETRVVSLDKGSQLCRIEVVYHNLSQQAAMTTGIVLHDIEGDMIYSSEGGYAAYAEPVDAVNGQTYLAMVYGAPVMDAEPKYFDEQEREERGAKGHLLLERIYEPGEKVTYYTGAGWSKWGFNSPQEWYDYVSNFANRVATPVVVTVK